MAKNRITFAEELVLRNGNVGIGTSAPTDNLDVRGTAKVTGSMTVTGNLQFGGISPIGDLSSLYKQGEAEGTVPYSNVMAREGDSLSGVGFNTTGTTAYVISVNDDKIHQYSLSTPWYLSSGTKIAEKNLNSLDFNVNDSYFISVNNDESKIFFWSGTTRRMVELELLTPGDIQTSGIATFHDPYPNVYDGHGYYSMELSDDGTKVISVVDASGEEVLLQYELDTPFDLGSVSGISSSLWVAFNGTQPNNVIFKFDGSKAYVVEDQRNRLLEYDLVTPWQIKTGKFSGRFLDLGVNPWDGAWKTDGTVLFIASGSTIYSWTLSSAWDLSTASSSTSYSVSAQEANVRGLEFKSDGGRFYICGDTGRVNEYSLGIAWNLTTVLHEGSLDVGTFLYNNSFDNASSTSSVDGNLGITTQKAILPRGIGISTDGTKVFVGDYWGGYITQWDLSTPWDVTSGVSTNTTLPVRGRVFQGFRFDPTGNYIYSSDNRLNVVQQYYLSTPWDVTTATTTKGVVGIRDHVDAVRACAYGDSGNKVYIWDDGYDGILYQYKLSRPYDISSLTYEKSVPVRKGFVGAYSLVTVYSIKFSSDGLKLILASTRPNSVYTFELTTPWDIETIQPLNDDSFSGFRLFQDNFAFDISPNGEKVFVLDRDSDYLMEYTLEEPWNFNTASITEFAYVRYGYDYAKYDFPAGFARYGIKFRPDGKEFYVIFDFPDYMISTFELSNPWDLSSIKWRKDKDKKHITFGIPYAQGYTNIENMEFDLDGNRLYLQDNRYNYIYQIDLATPWDVSSGVYNGVYVVSPTGNNFGGLSLSKDGFTMYVGCPPLIYEYTLTTPFDISTASLTGNTFDASQYDVNFRNLVLRPNNTELFVGGGQQDRIFRFKFDTKKVSINADIVLTGNTQIGEGLSVNGNSKFGKGEFTKLGIGATIANRDFSTDLVVSRNSDLRAIGSKKDISTLRLLEKYPKFHDPSRDRDDGVSLQTLTFKPDGTKYYTVARSIVIDANVFQVFEHTLETAWDISTAHLTASFNIEDESSEILASCITFKPDGTKFYLTRSRGTGSNYKQDYIDQYDLDTAWDIGTARRVKTFYVGNQFAGITNIKFKSDGSTFITLSQDTTVQYPELNQYTLSNNWELDSASHTFCAGNGRLGYITDDTPLRYCRSMYISDDGTRIYIGAPYTGSSHGFYGLINASITLTTPWDLSTYYFDKEYSGSNYNYKQTTESGNYLGNIYDFYVSPDGYKVYCLETTPGIVRQYDLKTAWDFYSGPKYPVLNVSSTFQRFEFSHDGKFIFVQGNIDRIYKFALTKAFEPSSVVSTYFYQTRGLNPPQFNYSRGIFKFGDKGRKLYFASQGTDSYGGMNVVQTDLKYPYAIELPPVRTYRYEVDASYNVGYPRDIEFNNDGTKFYWVSDQSHEIYEVDVPTPWDLSSITESSTFAVDFRDGMNEAAWQGDFSADGMQFFVPNYSQERIYKYTLTEPYEINHKIKDTSDYLQYNSLLTSDIRGIYVGAGGTYLYATNLSGDTVDQIAVDENNFTNSTLVGSFYVGAQEPNPHAVGFKTDGTSMYVVGNSNDRIQQYDLSTPWDVTSATFVTNYYPNTGSEFGDNDLYSIDFSQDGTKMYVAGYYEMGQFDLATPWDVTTATFIGRQHNITIEYDRDNHLHFRFSRDGRILYTYNVRTAVFKYNLSTPWDIRTAVTERPKHKTIALRSSPNQGDLYYPNQLHFERDGLTLYVLNYEQNAYYYQSFPENSRHAITQYDLGKAWDVSTAGFTTFYTLPNVGMNRFAFHPNKKRLFVLNSGFSNSVWIEEFEYGSEKTLDFTSEVDFHASAHFNYGLDAEGLSRFDAIGIGSTAFNEHTSSKLVVRGNTETESIGNDINLHTMRFNKSAVDINSFSFFEKDSNVDKYISENNLTGPEFNLPTLTGFTISDDGKYVYATGNEYYWRGSAVLQYELETPWDVTTGITTSLKTRRVHDDFEYFNTTGAASTDSNVGVFYPYGIGFGSDGKYMYVGGNYTFASDGSIEADGRNAATKIVQYTLDTEWDCTTVNVGLTTFITLPNYKADPSNPGYYPRIPQDIKFDDTGSRMYVINDTYNRIFQFDMSTPWQVGTASTEVKVTFRNTELGYSRGLAFKNSKELFVMSGNHGINPVGLKTDWEINSDDITDGGSYWHDQYSFGNIIPFGGYGQWTYGLQVKPDGKRFYVMSGVQRRLYQIDLESAWDFSTIIKPNYGDDYPIISGPAITHAWNNGQTHVSDGERGFVITPDGKSFIKVYSNAFYETKVNTPYKFFGGDLKDSNYYSGWYSDRNSRRIVLNNNRNLNTNYANIHTDILDIGFSRDGKYFFVLDSTRQRLERYYLEVPFNINDTVDYVDDVNFYVFGIPFIRTFDFSGDGKVLAVSTHYSGIIYQFDLKKPYDLSTAEFLDDSFPVRFENMNLDYTALNSTTVAEDSDPRGVYFKPDGTRMYIAGDGRNAVYQFELSTPWEVRTAGPGITTYFDVSSEGTDLREITFSTDGTEMYLAQWEARNIDQYTLSEAWNLGTASYTASFSTTNPTSVRPYAANFKTDGTKLYVAGENSSIYQYTLSTPWDITSATYDDTFYDFYYPFGSGTQDVTYHEPLRAQTYYFRFTDDGKYVYYGDNTQINRLPLREAWNIGSVYIHEGSDSHNVGEYRRFRIYSDLGNGQNGGFYVKPDDKKLYIASSANIRSTPGYHDRIFQYEMDTPGDLDSLYQKNRKATWNALDIGLYSEVDCIRFHPNGRKLYVANGYRETLFAFELQNKWDITSFVDLPTRIPYRNYLAAGQYGNRIRYFQFIDAGSRIVAQSNNREIIVFEIDDAKQPLEITAHTNIHGNLDVASNVKVNSELDATNIKTNKITISEGIRDKSHVGLKIDSIADIETIGVNPDIRDITYELPGPKITNAGITTTIREINVSRANSRDVDFYSTTESDANRGLSFSGFGKYIYYTGYDREYTFITQYELKENFKYNTQSIIGRETIDLEDVYPRFRGFGAIPTDIYVSNDGVNLYVTSYDVGIGTSGVVHQYVMSTPHNIKTAGYTTSFDASVYENVAFGLFFKPDGTEMYLSGHTSDSIHQFTLSTPWDVSSSGFTTSLSVSPQAVNPYGMNFNDDGTKFYYSNGPSTYQYTLGTPWDIDTAVYDNTGYNSERDKGFFQQWLYGPGNQGLGYFRFSYDGRKVFYMDYAYNSETVTFELETPWDVTSAKRNTKFLNWYRLTGGKTIKQYGIVDSPPELIRFSPDGKIGYILASRSTGKHEIVQVSLKEPYEIGTAEFTTFINLFDAGLFRTGAPNPASTYVSGFDIKSDGTRLYFCIGYQSDAGYNNSVNHVEYLDLNIPWDITSYRSSVGINSVTDWYWFNTSVNSSDRLGNPYSINFKPDGTSFFINDLEVGRRGIYEYKMEYPWDISTADQVFRTLTTEDQETGGNGRGIYMSPDNTMLFMVGTESDAVYRYDIPENHAGNINKAKWSGISTSFTAIDSEPTGIFIKPDGMKMYISGDAANSIHEFDLSVAWDVSSALYSQSLDVSSETTSPQDVRFSEDGSLMFVSAYDNSGNLIKYKLSTPWDVSSATLEVRARVTPYPLELTWFYSFAFSPDGYNLIISDGYDHYPGNDLYHLKLRNPYSITEIESINNIRLQSGYYYPNGIMNRHYSIFFDKTGEQLYILNDRDTTYGAHILTLTLPNPYSVNGAYLDGFVEFSYAGTEGNSHQFTSDGSTLITHGAGYIYLYNLREPWKIHTANTEYDPTIARVTANTEGVSSFISLSGDNKHFYLTANSGTYRGLRQYSFENIKPTKIKNSLDVGGQLNVNSNATVGGITIKSPTFDMPAAGIGTTAAPGVLYVNSEGKVRAGSINSQMFFTPPVTSISTITNNVQYFDTPESRGDTRVFRTYLYGGALAPNGMIYGMIGVDSYEGVFLEINPDTRETRYVGGHDRYKSSGSNYFGCVLHPNGKIYSAPHSDSNILVFDPISETTDYIQLDPAPDSTSAYISICLGRNGKLYSMPYNASQMLEYDPVTGITSYYGSFVVGGEDYGDTVLGGNGKIYGIPFDRSTVAEFDPDTQTMTEYGSLSGGDKWWGGVLAPNGKIYGIPYSSSTILEIDCENQTTRTFGSFSGSGKWRNGTLAPNGKIYATPWNNTTILEIDPVVGTAQTVAPVISGREYYGSILAPNGKIYGLPNIDDPILEFTPPNNVGINTMVGLTTSYANAPWIYSAYVNQY